MPLYIHTELNFIILRSGSYWDLTDRILSEHRFQRCYPYFAIYMDNILRHGFYTEIISKNWEFVWNTVYHHWTWVTSIHTDHTDYMSQARIELWIKYLIIVLVHMDRLVRLPFSIWFPYWYVFYYVILMGGILIYHHWTWVISIHTGHWLCLRSG
jgi:hypothetical protein